MMHSTSMRPTSDRSPSPRRIAGVPAIRLTMALGLVGSLVPAIGRAELPPTVYAERQRQALVVADLEVQRVSRNEDEVHLRAKVLAVRRLSKGVVLETGQRIDLQYTSPQKRWPGFVGPGAIPVPVRGQQVRAWLNPIKDRPGGFAPAAGSQSFGAVGAAF
jgi:hypothetical protein